MSFNVGEEVFIESYHDETLAEERGLPSPVGEIGVIQEIVPVDVLMGVQQEARALGMPIEPAWDEDRGDAYVTAFAAGTTDDGTLRVGVEMFSADELAPAYENAGDASEEMLELESQ